MTEDERIDGQDLTGLDEPGSDDRLDDDVREKIAEAAQAHARLAPEPDEDPNEDDQLHQPDPPFSGDRPPNQG